MLFTCCLLQNITDEALQLIGRHCHDLIFLCVANCQRLTDNSLVSIANGCPALRYKGSLANGCPALRYWDLYSQQMSCLKVFGVSIANGCPALRY